MTRWIAAIFCFVLIAAAATWLAFAWLWWAR